jgi:hypothetical protein
VVKGGSGKLSPEGENLKKALGAVRLAGLAEAARDGDEQAINAAVDKIRAAGDDKAAEDG